MLTLPCPYCQKLVDVPPIHTTDGLIRCGVCDKVSQLHRNISFYSLSKYRFPDNEVPDFSTARW